MRVECTDIVARPLSVPPQRKKILFEWNYLLFGDFAKRCETQRSRQSANSPTQNSTSCLRGKSTTKHTNQKLAQTNAVEEAVSKAKSALAQEEDQVRARRVYVCACTSMHEVQCASDCMMGWFKRVGIVRVHLFVYFSLLFI